MVDPGVLDITIHQGATFNLELQYLDSTGSGVDMTGYSVDSKIVEHTTNATLATFTSSFTDAGKFKLSLSSNVTAAMTQDGVYDVLLTQPNGEKFFLIHGRSKIDPGITGVL